MIREASICSGSGSGVWVVSDRIAKYRNILPEKVSIKCVT